MKVFKCFGFITLILPFMVLAEPFKLHVTKQVRHQASDKYINAVHKEIVPSSTNLQAIRYGILEGMLNTRGYKWLYEGEGEGFILARFDYRGDTNIMRIEYNKDLVQIKYHSAWGDLVCEKEVAGICYKNSRGYYGYVKNLRKSIAKEVSTL